MSSTAAMSPFALGTSQPATEVMVETFKGTPYDTGYDQKLLAEIADYFRPIRDECSEERSAESEGTLVLTSRLCCIRYRAVCFPTWLRQLKEQHAEDKYLRRTGGDSEST